MQLIKLLCLFVMMCCYTVKSVKQYNYHRDSQDLNIIKLNANPNHYINSMWIIVIQHPNTYQSTDNTTIAEMFDAYIKLDECTLLSNAIGDDQLVFKVFCNNVSSNNNNDDDDSGDINAELPFQQYTLNEFLYKHFAKSDIHIEQNKPIRKPHFFYGTPEILKYARQLDRNITPGATDKIQHIMKPGNLMQKQSLFMNPSPWALDRIDQRVGLLDNTFQYSTGAQDIDVYVLDTGVRVTHKEFQGRAKFLFNAVGDDVDTDCAGHGTFCASEIGGANYGVAKKTNIYGIKILDCLGNGDLYSIQTGVMAAIEQSRVNKTRRSVASLSLGGSKSTLLDNAVNSLASNNIVVIVSAGNEGANSCLYSPSNMGGDPSKSIITVGASDINDDTPRWSNYGPCVSISAPGVSIVGAWYTADDMIHVLSGTSMSCPLVAGVAALVLQQDPTLTPKQVKKIILEWATPGVIAFASPEGGGQNLLYSLIDLNVSPPPPPATLAPLKPSPVPPKDKPIPGKDVDYPYDNKGSRNNVVSLPLLIMSLMISLFLFIFI